MSGEFDLERFHAHQKLARFLAESLMIEGVHRAPTREEISATESFLRRKRMTVDAICALQAVYTPGMPLRMEEGQDVYVGRYKAPPGGPAVGYALAGLCRRIAKSTNPWQMHVEFEKLHPFCDGNGRSGRALWAWHMQQLGRDPFALSFLHRFYYQTLENVDRSDE